MTRQIQRDDIYLADGAPHSPRRRRRRRRRCRLRRRRRRRDVSRRGVNIAAAYHLWAWLISYRSSLPRIAGRRVLRAYLYTFHCVSSVITAKGDAARLRSACTARRAENASPILISRSCASMTTERRH